MIDVIMRFIFMSKLFDITLQKRNSLLSKRAGNEWAENRNKNFKITIINRMEITSNRIGYSYQDDIQRNMQKSASSCILYLL
ncbi:hypothetical protein EG349_03770 [Chryseobacterium shandongense]|uniref:Uncharacterized protein n=1 Tax=Chryseobacterium shandongense TaxID=1493872 RepID=A0AAD0YG91_9FLAO|nr:hypothetical protein EG349_03770 [Chryseobacterium shandongense]AZA94374.1 hypothetical protein EG353_01795 [Chryseobacterium shandongense]